MARKRLRSRKPAAVLIQTRVIPDVANEVERRAETSGETVANWVRRLLHETVAIPEAGPSKLWLTCTRCGSRCVSPANGLCGQCTAFHANQLNLDFETKH